VSRKPSQLDIEPQPQTKKDLKKPEPNLQDTSKNPSKFEFPTKKPKTDVEQKPAVFKEDKKHRKRSEDSASSEEKSPKIIKASKLKTRVHPKPESEFTEDYINQIAEIIDNEEATQQQQQPEQPTKKKPTKPKPPSHPESESDQQAGKQSPVAAKAAEPASRVFETPLKSALSGGSQISSLE